MSSKSSARIACTLWLCLYLAWYWISPWLQTRWNHPDEAAWLGLFLLPTTILGGATGLMACLKPNRRTVPLFAFLTIAHSLVGLGIHPR